MKKLLHKRWLRPVLIAFLALALLGALGTIQVSQAFEMDEDGIIEKSQVINDDVLLSGEQVVVDGTVNGSLIVSCQDAEINGSVTGDLVIRGRDVTVNGHVGGNILVASMTFTLNGTVDGSVFAMTLGSTLGPSSVVSRNLTFTGFGLETEPGSRVERDIQTGGFQALIGGEVGRHLTAETTALEITGDIGGDVVAIVEAPDEPLPFTLPGVSRTIGAGLRVAEGARIGGRLSYTSPVDQADAIEITPGGGTEHLLPETTGKPGVNWLVERIRELLTLLILGVLVAWKAPTLLNQLSGQAKAKPIPAALRGLLVGIGGFLAALVVAGLLFVVWLVLAATTLGGLSTPVFFIGGSGYVLALSLFMLIVLYGARLVVAHLVGKLILKPLAPKMAEKAIWPMLVGVVLYFAVESIPCIGWVAWLVATLLGLGAIWLLLRRRRADAAPGDAAPTDVAPVVEG